MELRLVISDPGSGKSYQIELKDEKAKRLKNLKIGDEVDGGIVGLQGYKLEITGGSDNAGFPMKRGVHGTKRAMIFMTRGVGYNPDRDVRRRKRVRGEQIDEDIMQVNTKITQRTEKSIEELLGIKPAEKPTEEKAKEE